MSPVWGAFVHDPRDPAHEELRASDLDRDVVAEVLTEAFADGRLTREEYDDRAATLAASRTLGELPALLTDLVPSGSADRTPVLRPGSTPMTVPNLQAKAVAAYESDRRDALLGFVGPSLICVVIWAIINWGTWEFFWPGFVMAGTLVNVLRVVVRRTDIVEEHRAELQRKEERRLEKAREKELRRGELEARAPQGEE